VRTTFDPASGADSTHPGISRRRRTSQFSAARRADRAGPLRRQDGVGSDHPPRQMHISLVWPSLASHRSAPVGVSV